MPTQPINSTTCIDAAITNMAIAYAQDQTDFVSTKVFPMVSVDRQTGKYFIFDKQGFLRNDMQPRASGTEAQASGFTVSTSSYSCDVNALKTTLSNQDRGNWDEASLGNVDRAKARYLMHQALQSAERQWVTDFFSSSVWATDSTPSVLWDVSTSTPIENVLTGKTTVKTSTGREPNTMVVGYQVHSKLIRHPDIIDLIKYGSGGSGNPAVATRETMAKVFGVANYYVAGAVKATNVEGETAATSFAAGKNALLCYVTDAPSKEEPSAGYTFTWTGVGGGKIAESVAISNYYEQRIKSDVWEIEQAWDNVVTGADLGYFFASVIS